jgi:hypothetical protein
MLWTTGMKYFGFLEGLIHTVNLSQNFIILLISFPTKIHETQDTTTNLSTSLQLATSIEMFYTKLLHLFISSVSFKTSSSNHPLIIVIKLKTNYLLSQFMCYFKLSTKNNLSMTCIYSSEIIWNLKMSHQMLPICFHSKSLQNEVILVLLILPMAWCSIPFNENLWIVIYHTFGHNRATEQRDTRSGNRVLKTPVPF